MHALLGFDTTFVHWMGAVRPLWAAYTATDISQLGSTVTIAGFTMIAAIIAWYVGRTRIAIGGIVSVVFGLAAFETLKYLIARSRPPIVDAAYPEAGSSFPSGHATESAALYGFLIILVAVSPLSPARKQTLILILGLVTLAVAGSRLVLAVHYPTDVLAGLVLGSVCAYIGARVARLV